MGLVQSLVDGIGAAIGGALLALGAVVTAPVRWARNNKRSLRTIEAELGMGDGTDTTRLDKVEARQRKLENQMNKVDRYFTGDPDDPGQSGLLADVQDIKDSLDEVDD